MLRLFLLVLEDSDETRSNGPVWVVGPVEWVVRVAEVRRVAECGCGVCDVVGVGVGVSMLLSFAAPPSGLDGNVVLGKRRSAKGEVENVMD